MIPVAFIELDAIPLTPNGKVDRKKLAMREVHLQLTRAYVGPENETEQKLVDIWQDLLHLDQVGIHDNFFELGGHSLLATQVISQIRKVFEVELELRTLFECPTIEALAKPIAEGEKSLLLPLSVQARPEHIPMSYAQERLWFIDQLDASARYNIPAVMRLKGAFHPQAFSQSFETLIKRHEILRTRFDQLEGKGVQVIHDDTTPAIHHLDLSKNEQSLEYLNELILKEVHSPFDLPEGPLMRITIIKLSAQETILIVNMHHIISDAWSFSVIVKELNQLYNAYSQNQPCQLPPLPIQYADYSLWQRQILTEQQLAQQLNYWQDHLSGYAGSLDIPTDFQRPAMQSGKGGRIRFELSKALTQEVNELSQRYQCTLFMIHLAALYTLLRRYSRQEDICIGTPIANRTQADVEGLIGFFVNTLALRLQTGRGADIETLLAETKKITLASAMHQEVPFEKLVETLQPERDMSRTPIFQVMLAYQNTAHMQPVALRGLTFEPIETDYNIAKFDLTFDITEHEDHIQIGIEYSTDLFQRCTIERMQRHFIRIVEAFTKDPLQKLEHINLLSPKEKQKLLIDWNNTQANYPKDKCIHELFEAQTRKTPNAIAVVFEDHKLSYKELDQKSTELAKYLQSMGVKPDTLVAICVERSLEMIVGLLGILKAGGAYVPLDPEYPQERLEYMLDDCQTNILLSQSYLMDKVKSLTNENIKLIYLDRDRQTIRDTAKAQKRLKRSVRSNHLAYVIYTSGSTGNPKGVCIRHSSLNNLCTWHRQAMNVDCCARATQVASLTFDASVWEMWPYLIFGASLYLVHNSIYSDKDKLMLFLSSQCITHCFVPTPLAEILLDSDWSGPYQLKFLLTGGDRLSVFYNKEYPFKIVNNYGPTESTVVATSLVLNKAQAIPPIGKPINNTKAYILSYDLELLPIGIAGELCIAGDGLARGYLNQPELTAEKFIDNPFEPGTRLYRTGDLARWLADGTIEFLGRIDDQVKIRGYRIELGEIESQLNHHSAIQNSVVIVKEHHGNKQLIAYYVAEDNQTVEPAELKVFLAHYLPDYMIPVAFIELDAIPLTPNGKVDRKKLAMQDVLLQSPQGYVAPRNKTEQKLVAIWQSVLNRETVGIHDNFFELGGDSILSMQIVAKSQQQLVDVTVQELFQYQTIAMLAPQCHGRSQVVADQGLLEGPAPLLPIQHWFFEQSFEQQHHWNQSMLLTLRQAIRPETLQDVVKHLMNHHDALRFSYRNDQGSWQQSYEREVSSEDLVEHHDVSTFAKEAQLKKIEAYCNSAQTKFNLAVGPLIKLVLFTLGPKKSDQEMSQWLFIAIHHLAIDGVSWRILLEDLQTGVRQRQARQVIQLPPKTTAYSYWSQQLADFAKTERFRQQISYWTDQPWDMAGCIPLDFKTSKGANLESTIRHIEFQLNQRQTKQLLEEAGQAYNTRINEMLLAALAYAYQRWTGQDTLLVMLEGHGREALFDDVDISRTVGWFTSMFPVLLSTGGSLEETLKITKEQVRHIPQNGLGYGMLRYLTREPALETMVEPGVFFNYLGQFGQIESPESLFEGHQAMTSPVRSPRAHRTALLDINGIIQHQQLSITFSYSHKLHKEETIQSFADAYHEALCRIIEHCLQPDVGGYTPSDFPLIPLRQPELDELMLELATEQSIQVSKNIESIYPLSPLQQGILFETLLSPTSGMYIVQFSLLLKGKLDIPPMEQAWQAVVSRHTSLRTGFVYKEEKEPLQIVYKVLDFKLEYLDWRLKSKSDQKKALAERVAENKKAGFRLGQAPLMRISVIQTAEDEYRLLCCNHHLILDGWSMPILFGDVFWAYQAYRQGVTPQFAPCVPYQRHIEWITTQNHRKAERFWKEYLSDFVEPTPLPPKLSGTRTQQPRQRYKREAISLSPQVSEQLKQLGQTQRVTLNSILQTAWGLVLGKYADKDVVIFGGVSSGRQPEVLGSETMVGLLISTLPVKVYCQGEQSVLEEIKDFHQREIDKRQFEYTALTAIQKWLGVTTNEELFQTLFVFENYPLEAGRIEHTNDLSILEVSGEEQPHYAITLACMPGKTITLQITYDHYYYDQIQIIQLLAHYKRIVTGIANNPVQKLSDLSLLSLEEKQKILIDWNNTQADYPKDQCIHQLFEEQAKKTPHATAVIFEEKQLSYKDLDQKSTELAKYLQSMGVKPDTLVVICLERSLEMIVGLLGILKAGGAYVPLDPDYPEERLRYMLSDCGAKHILSQSHLADKVQVLTKDTTKIVYLDQDWQTIRNTEKAQKTLSRNVRSNHLAYVIYTSGSTGQPKGVQIEHQALVNHMNWMSESLKWTEDDVFLQKTAFSFDASVWEFFASILSGGKLILLSPGNQVDVEPIFEAIQRYNVTVLQAVPTLFKYIIEHDLYSECVSLQKICCGGEALSLETIFKAKEKLSVEIINLYGPTECTIDCLYHRCDENFLGKFVPIGKPVSNIKAYILDTSRNQVPIGVPGELHIGGAGIARGYLNRPELTRKQFIQNPFSDDANDRMYRTGDLARWLADGNIEFLGRIDDQVKIRGFRIELREIENQLNNHPRIQNNVVIVKEQHDTKQLIAYYVLENNQTVEPTELKVFLAQYLPDYMIPASFLPLEKIPLNPNGKIDRKALLRNEVRLESSQEYVTPQTETEKQLTHIWQELLRVEKVGIHDNFFELGGHSLLSIQLIQRIKQVLGIALPVQELFTAPTIFLLTKKIDSKSTSATSSNPIQTKEKKDPSRDQFSAIFSKFPELVLLNQIAEGRPVFWFHGGLGGVEPYYIIAEKSQRPFYGIQARGWMTDRSSLDGIQAMAAYYIHIIQSVQSKGPYELGGYSLGRGDCLRSHPSITRIR